MVTGSCLCGGIQFEIDGEPAPIQVCHCSQCRKAQGTPFATNIPVPTSSFHLKCGSELLREFESSPGKRRVFCSRCGSPIFSKRDQMPDVIRIRAGLLEGPLAAGPAAHFYVGSSVNWWQINDELPQFEGGQVPR